jgi:hypothetical protein
MQARPLSGNSNSETPAHGRIEVSRLTAAADKLLGAKHGAEHKRQRGRTESSVNFRHGRATRRWFYAFPRWWALTKRGRGSHGGHACTSYPGAKQSKNCNSAPNKLHNHLPGNFLRLVHVTQGRTRSIGAPRTRSKYQIVSSTKSHVTTDVTGPLCSRCLR